MARTLRTVSMALMPATAALGQWTAVHMHPGGNNESGIYAVAASMQGGEYVAATSPTGPTYYSAVLWSGSPQSWVSLAPAMPQSNSVVLGIDGNTQVGSYLGAALWHGTPESRVDLAPPGSRTSAARAVRGDMQVGSFTNPGPTTQSHAVLWRGTAESFVDLHPSWAAKSQCYATDGVLQGGHVRFAGPGGGLGDSHAVIWNGTPESVIDLNPPGMTSEILGMAPGVQVGMAKGIGNMRAAVWNGSVESYVNFHPPGDPGASWFTATTGTIHVGRWTYGPGGSGRAAINFGTPESWLGLHDLLPSHFTTFSMATSVYQDGDTIYVGGYALNDLTGNNEAFLWIGTIPAPGATTLLIAAGATAARRARRRGQTQPRTTRSLTGTPAQTAAGST